MYSVHHWYTLYTNYIEPKKKFDWLFNQNKISELLVLFKQIQETNYNYELNKQNCSFVFLYELYSSNLNIESETIDKSKSTFKLLDVPKGTDFIDKDLWNNDVHTYLYELHYKQDNKDSTGVDYSHIEVEYVWSHKQMRYIPNGIKVL